jgi:DnaD/phage-associated family protein
MKKKDKIQIKFNYDSSVAVLPAGALNYIDKAKKFDIKVLLLIASSESYRDGKYAQSIASELSCTEAEVEASVSFWNGTGLISTSSPVKASESKAEKTSTKKEAADDNVPKRAKVSELPVYTSKELNSLLEKHKNAVELIDECQNILGKIFTAADIKTIMGLVDYLGLDNDYIVVLMHYAARNEIKSMRAIEKVAISCLDDGFTEAKALSAELKRRENVASVEGKIRSMFGIGQRKLIGKEQKQIDAWFTEYKYDLSIIEKAYEITVSATGKPSIHYTHAILEKWYAEGVRTLDDVNALIEKRAQEKSEEGSSFNVDDFFDAALKRSYSDK